MSEKARTSSCPSQAWAKRMAAEEDRHESISVGGMAHDLGMLYPTTKRGSGAFGQLIEYARRRQHLSLEELADKIEVDLAELVNLERNASETPSPRTVQQLSLFLNIPLKPLLEVAGLTEPSDPRLRQATIRFAARAEPTADLSPQENQVLEEFVKSLSEAS